MFKESGRNQTEYVFRYRDISKGRLLVDFSSFDSTALRDL